MEIDHSYSSEGRAFVELTLEVYRLNGLLIEEGNRLSRKMNLSAARWSVMGALAIADRPLAVSHVARTMGLARQSVQRVVGDLVDSQHVERLDNPEHKRAYLIRLTPKGQRDFRRLDRIEAAWANGIAAGLGVSKLDRALQTLRSVRERLTIE